MDGETCTELCFQLNLFNKSLSHLLSVQVAKNYVDILQVKIEIPAGLIVILSTGPLNLCISDRMHKSINRFLRVLI